MVEQKNEKIIVQSLIGGSQLSFYLFCLKSLVKYCQDDIDLQLHTDGTVSQEDKDSIHSENQMKRRSPLLTQLQIPVVHWIIFKADQTVKNLEKILFGGLNSLILFTHFPKIR